MCFLLDINGKPLPFQLAVLHNKVEFVRELTQMSLSSTYSGAFGVEGCVEIALEQDNYAMTKAIFDERLYLATVINRMINLCLLDDTEYTSMAPTKCKNFVFFKKLLKQAGASSLQVLNHVLWSERIEYITYLLDINHTFAEKFSCIDVWNGINQYCINSRVMKSMIQTNVDGFRYSAIGDSDVYYGTIFAVCSKTDNYTKANAYDSNQFRCFILLLGQPEIQKILKDDNEKMLEILEILIITNKLALIKYLFDFTAKAGWNVNFSAKITETYNALTYSIEFGNVCPHSLLYCCAYLSQYIYTYFVCI